MTAASLAGPSLFSVLSRENDLTSRTRREAFVFSLLGQAAILGLIVYFTSCVIRTTPAISRQLPRFAELPLIFSGHNGGGGGTFDVLPASHGNLPPSFSRDSNCASSRHCSKGATKAPDGGNGAGRSGNQVATRWTDRRSHVAVLALAVEWSGWARRHGLRMLRRSGTFRGPGSGRRAGRDISGWQDGRHGA